MSAAEKNCRWHFASGANYTIGLTDAAGENFSDAMNSLVRECIQNSLDAVLDPKEPVRIIFEFKGIPMNNFSNFFELKDHIQACVETFRDQAQKHYVPMLEYFDESMIRTGDRMSYLKISDFNTKGMNYDKNNLSSDFSAFVRSLGVHGGDQTSAGRGGSFGLGKSTFFMMSPFRTMFVSTYSSKQQYVFEGVASLATHQMNGKTFSHIGYYDSNNGNPVSSFDDIPGRFVRKADANGVTPFGTDIFVMGRQEAEDDVKSIITSVLLNYWLSVYKNKLVVEVKGEHENCIIDQSSLPELMDQYFCQHTDNARKSINPRPYYDAVTTENDMDDRRTVVRKTLPHIGNVELYLIKVREAKSDRIAFFRLPCMMIMRRSSTQLMLGTSTYGVYGVFMCVDTNGDRILKNLENAAHDEWNEKHWRDQITGKTSRNATAVMDELKDFLRESIEEFCKQNNQVSMKMLGAGKYLYTVRDLVEHADNDNSPSDNGIHVGGGFSDTETGMRGSDYSGYETDTPSGKSIRDGEITNEEGQATTKTDKGGISVLVTPPKKKRNKKTKRNKGGTTEVSGEFTSDSSAASVIVPVEYKLYAGKENGLIVHNISIFVDYDVPSAKIEFVSRREDGKIDNELSIAYTDLGVADEMEIHGVHLQQGNNMLKIRFNDSVKHSLTITVKRK